MHRSRATFEIRPDRPSDARAIWTVHEAAFGRPDEARLAARLRQEASPLVSLVAEQVGRVIGHVLFSPVTVEDERERPGVTAGALGPVAVLPDAQGQGAGASLIRAGIEACRALDWRILFVLGDPTYYARLGFGLAARTPFGVGRRIGVARPQGCSAIRGGYGRSVAQAETLFWDPLLSA